MERSPIEIPGNPEDRPPLISRDEDLAYTLAMEAAEEGIRKLPPAEARRMLARLCEACARRIDWLREPAGHGREARPADREGERRGPGHAS